jgi:hypothetical protein
MHRLATTKDIVDDDKKAPQTGPSSLLCKASEALPPCIGLGGVTFGCANYCARTSLRPLWVGNAPSVAGPEGPDSTPFPVGWKGQEMAIGCIQALS